MSQRLAIGRRVVIPATDLKICSVALAVFWATFMLWWSDGFDRSTVLTAMLCGSLAGYAGYRAMRWQPPRGRICRDGGGRSASSVG